MKLHTTGHVACLLLVCTIILQVYSVPLQDSTWQQTAAADSIIPLTVRPLGTSNMPQVQANNSYWDTKATTTTTTTTTTTKETDTDSDSSYVSADVSKRSADGDTPSGKEDTEDNPDETTTDTDQEPEDDCIDDNADEQPDTRRRRNAENEQRDKQRDDEDNNEEEDGGLTREAAVVSPIRRRRSHDNKDHTDVSTTEAANYDDTNSDTTEDTESTEESTETLYRRRREAEVSTLGTLEGSPVIVVAPPGTPVKKIPQELDQTVQKLEKEIDTFEEDITGQSTVSTVGVLAGHSTKRDNGTIIQTISSAQYIVH